jgi:hypothetical protein
LNYINYGGSIRVLLRASVEPNPSISSDMLLRVRQTIKINKVPVCYNGKGEDGEGGFVHYCVRVSSKEPGEFLPTSIQKSYFMLSRSARAVLDTALRKYRPGRSDLIPVGEIAQLKPALQLMMSYRLVIQEVTGAEVMTSYTRWLECVQLKGDTEPEVYVAFSPRFEQIWAESRKRLPKYMEQKPANAMLRSQYSLRLYSWAKKYVEGGAKTISLEELRRVFGLESIEDAEGNVIKEAPLPVWANFQQRALDVAILEIRLLPSTFRTQLLTARLWRWEPDEGDLVRKAEPVMRAPALAELREIFLGQAGGALELVAGKHYRCDTANAEVRKDGSLA